MSKMSDEIVKRKPLQEYYPDMEQRWEFDLPPGIAYLFAYLLKFELSNIC